jgi:hypothetical protein
LIGTHCRTGICNLKQDIRSNSIPAQSVPVGPVTPWPVFAFSVTSKSGCLIFRPKIQILQYPWTRLVSFGLIPIKAVAPASLLLLLFKPDKNPV